jgi:hypothetical protein
MLTNVTGSNATPPLVPATRLRPAVGLSMVSTSGALGLVNV